MTQAWSEDSQGLLNDRYQRLQRLGHKPGRQTWLAQDQLTQERVVVKLLTFSSDFNWDDWKLFEREAATLQALSHPAIPRYLDSFELEMPGSQGFALVQTYIPAQSLEQHLRAGRTFSESEVKQLAKDLLEILIYLHDRQPPMIHRDIKPSNILLGDRSGNQPGQVYLVDFGSVQTLAAREGGTMTIVGTYGYMPPEQFGGRAVPASDLYSLGATLIYLVTGVHPADLPQEELRLEFASLSQLSPALTYWLQRMTDPSLKRRFASAQDALQALEQPQSNLERPLTKPLGSRITLKQDSHELEILLPPTGFSPSLGSRILFAIAWNSFIIFWTSMAIAIPAGMSIFFLLFSLPFWGAGLGMVRYILVTLFERVHLRLTAQQISQVHELLGFRFAQRQATLQDSPRLELESVGNTKVRILLWVGTQKFELIRTTDLAEVELEWLAQELSHWLGVAIDHKQLPPPS